MDNNKKVTVLFCATDSIYKTMGIDCYDKDRNAMTYQGNNRVIAHPPCQLWGSMASVNFARWGGEHNRPENDGGMFRFALDTVRRCGGVLEHPAKTRAWKAYGLTKPTRDGWQLCNSGGWVCEVWQSAYGHRANKATWLYYIGDRPLQAIWQRQKGTHQIGFYDQRGKKKNKPTLSKCESNATPVKFAEYLINLVIGL